MYAFLGLVLQKDYVKGNIKPKFILCKRNKQANNRMDYIVCQEERLKSYPIVIVSSFYGNDYLVEFLSNYRTRDFQQGRKHKYHKSTLKYTPIGALFWFECDKNGRQTGPALFIKKVPDKNFKRNETNERLLNSLNKKRTLLEKINEDNTNMIIETKKPHIRGVK